MLKVAISGSEGMLGSCLTSSLVGVKVIPLTKENCDITNSREVEEVIHATGPDVLIHCAAMTAVDLCESEQFLAWKNNAFGTTNVARSCHSNGVKLIAISTDYVFDGKLERPYNEYDQAGGAVNIYGKSKWAAEQAVRSLCPNHLIARTSWLYGGGGPSFVHTMLRLADGSRPFLKVVNDQQGNPTSTEAVASALNVILQHPELVGTVHLTCEGEATWYEFSKAIFQIMGIEQNVIPCRSDDFPTPAKRPKNSRLEKLVLKESGIYEMPLWKEALEEFLKKAKGCN